VKGIILAGGTGSRLLPLTRVTNKHLLPVGGVPMIVHPVRKLVEAGITDILVVTGTEHAGAILGLLGSGSEYGCQFTYRVQDTAGGIAQALGLAEGFVGNDKMCVLLGDNIFEESLAPHVELFRREDCQAKILISDVSDPQRYGVPEFSEAGKLVAIDEKPAKPKSIWAVTGIYFYDSDVFPVIARMIKPSARGELEITDVNNTFLRHGQLHYAKMRGWWTDAGTHDSLRLANELVSGTPVDNLKRVAKRTYERFKDAKTVEDQALRDHARICI
jgi:glucose-1-phosphate thymidylyltransferase